MADALDIFADKLKALSVSVIAVLALGAWGATAASAEPLFHAGAEHTILDAESLGNQVLSGSELEFSCTEFGLEGTVAAASGNKIAAAPVYGGCQVSKASESFNAHVEASSCEYALGSTLEKEHEEEHAPLTIECDESDEIHVKATVLGFKVQCLTIPAQTPATGLTYATGAKRGKADITVEATATEVEYTLHSNCGGKEEEGYETKTDGAYQGEATVSGTDTEENPVSLRWGAVAKYFHAESEHVLLDGSASGTQVFSGNEVKVKCAALALEGTLGEATSGEAAVTPAYSECTAESESEELASHVDPSSCYYVFQSTLEQEHGEEHAPLSVNCDEGDEIHISITFLGVKIPCMTIPEQTPATGTTYSNGIKSGNVDVKLDATATALEYTLHSNCGGKEEEGYETRVDGSYAGKATLTATDTEESAVDIRWGPAQEHAFHSEVEHAILGAEAENSQVFSNSAELITPCGELAIDATLAEETADELAVVPTYGSCIVTSGAGEFEAHFEPTSCKFLLAGETVGDHAFIGIECSESDEIHVKATFLGFKVQCFTIPAQTATGGGFTYTNGEAEGKSVITVEVTTEGIEYTTHTNCGGEGEPYETREDTTYSGNFVIWAEDTEESRVDVYWE